MLQRSSWQFFAGLDAGGNPTWSGDSAAKKPAITIPDGVGRIGSAAYVRPLGRFLFLTEHTQRSSGYFALLEALHPWGPWRTVAYTRLADPRGRVETRHFFYNILANSLRDGGRGFTLVFTGGGNGDALLAAEGRLTLAPSG